MTDALFVTVNDAAGLLGVSPDLVRTLTAAGDLPAVRLGTRVRIPRAAIDALVARTLADFDPDRLAARLTRTLDTADLI